MTRLQTPKLLTPSCISSSPALYTNMYKAVGQGLYGVHPTLNGPVDNKNNNMSTNQNAFRAPVGITPISVTPLLNYYSTSQSLNPPRHYQRKPVSKLHQQLRQQAGFTLTEVLISLAALTAIADLRLCHGCRHWRLVAIASSGPPMATPMA